MTYDLLFKICNLIVMPAWLALAIWPNAKWTKYLVTGIAISLALVYAYFVPGFFQMEEGGFGSLAEVMLLFKSESAVLAGWIHYLVFDLWTGRWIATDAAAKKISKWWVAPCLLFTLMLGPVGFLLYSALRFFYAKKHGAEAAIL